MAADFFFLPPTHDVPSLTVLGFKWANIPHQDVAEVIAREEQYLNFHIFMLDNLRHTSAGQLDEKPYILRLGLSVRAGAIKAAILVCASIAEAALRSHAQARGYRLPADDHRRTFGAVLTAWKTSRRTPRPDVRAIWDDLQRLRDARNNVHLFRAAADPNAGFQQVLTDEVNLLNASLNVVDALANLRSP